MSDKRVPLSEFCEKLYTLTNGVGISIDAIERSTKMENKKTLHELIDQCRILVGKDNSGDIAEYLDKNNVVGFPVGIGDTVYFISVTTTFGSITTSGRVFARKVDALQYDGRIKIVSYRAKNNDPLGNCYAYLGDLVFLTEEDAENRLNEIQSSGYSVCTPETASGRYGDE